LLVLVKRMYDALEQQAGAVSTFNHNHASIPSRSAQPWSGMRPGGWFRAPLLSVTAAALG
jgi:hypothetical protein